jgi:hypothetical protein
MWAVAVVDHKGIAKIVEFGLYKIQGLHQCLGDDNGLVDIATHGFACEVVGSSVSGDRDDIWIDFTEVYEVRVSCK